jgi:hypothetical protein
MPDPQTLIRIGPGAVPLTKTQREFNRLTELVQTLSRALTDLRQIADALQRRLSAEYEPPYRQYLRLRADLVRLLDRAYRGDDLTSQEKKKLADLITDMAHDLVVRHGQTELADLYRTYDPTGLDPEQSQPPMMTDEPDSRDGSSTDPENVSTVGTNSARPDQDGEPASRPKSEKAQARAAKKLLAAQQATRSVRAVYLDLVKAFHPDREPDPTEQVRKTAIMQRVTAAYEAGDLLALLTLQIELIQHKSGYLDTAPDAQLRAYNRLLTEQVADLEAQQADLLRELTTINGRPLPKTNLLLTLEMSLNQDIKSLKREVKALKQELQALANPGVLRQWVR